MPVGSRKAGRGYPSGAFRPDVDQARNGKPIEAAQSFSPVGTPKMADVGKFASRSSGPDALTRSRRGELSSTPERGEAERWTWVELENGLSAVQGGESLDFGARQSKCASVRRDGACLSPSPRSTLLESSPRRLLVRASGPELLDANFLSSAIFGMPTGEKNYAASTGLPFLASSTSGLKAPDGYPRPALRLPTGMSGHSRLPTCSVFI